jgi:hypothetical protein
VEGLPERRTLDKMTKEQAEFVEQALAESIAEAKMYMPKATDDEIVEWVYHIGVHRSFSDELKRALAKEALKPWNMLPIILREIRMPVRLFVETIGKKGKKRE